MLNLTDVGFYAMFSKKECFPDQVSQHFCNWLSEHCDHVYGPGSFIDRLNSYCSDVYLGGVPKK